MRWPWQRRAEDGSGVGSAVPSAGPGPSAAVGPSGGAVSPSGWAFLPPLQRTIAPPLSTTHPHDLVAWRNPSFIGRLTHAVSPAAPSGVIDADGGGLGSPVLRAPAAELPLVASHSNERQQPLQRAALPVATVVSASARTGSPLMTADGAALPLLRAVSLPAEPERAGPPDAVPATASEAPASAGPVLTAFDNGGANYVPLPGPPHTSPLLPLPAAPAAVQRAVESDAPSLGPIGTNADAPSLGPVGTNADAPTLGPVGTNADAPSPGRRPVHRLGLGAPLPPGTTRPAPNMPTAQRTVASPASGATPVQVRPPKAGTEVPPVRGGGPGPGGASASEPAGGMSLGAVVENGSAVPVEAPRPPRDIALPVQRAADGDAPDPDPGPVRAEAGRDDADAIAPITGDAAVLGERAATDAGDRLPAVDTRAGAGTAARPAAFTLPPSTPSTPSTRSTRSTPSTPTPVAPVQRVVDGAPAATRPAPPSTAPASALTLAPAPGPQQVPASAEAARPGPAHADDAPAESESAAAPDISSVPLLGAAPLQPAGAPDTPGDAVPLDGPARTTPLPLDLPASPAPSIQRDVGLLTHRTLTPMLAATPRTGPSALPGALPSALPGSSPRSGSSAAGRPARATILTPTVELPAPASAHIATATAHPLASGLRLAVPTPTEPMNAVRPQPDGTSAAGAALPLPFQTTATAVQRSLATGRPAHGEREPVVQREVPAGAESLPEPDFGPPPPVPGTAEGAGGRPGHGAAPAAPAASAEELDKLAGRLLEPLTRRLKAEMLIDRERRGVRSDPR
jgi:hypothetical protein